MTAAVLPRGLPETRLVTAVDELLASPSVDLAPAHALERLGTVLTESERLAVAALDGVHDLEVRELFALDGHGSAAGWLRRRVGGDPRLVALARRLVDRPVIREALVAGRVDLAAAQKVCTALADVAADVSEDALVAVVTDGAAQVLDEICGGRASAADVAALHRLGAAAAASVGSLPSVRLEPVFTFLAERVPPAVLGRQLGELVDALIPARLDERGEDAYEAQYVELHQVLDGRWHVSGLLDPETGAALNAELDRRMAADDADDPDHSADSADAADFGSSPPRGKAHSRALALGSLARDGRGNHGTGNDRPAADITIIARQDTLEQQPGALPCRMSDGSRLPVDTVRRLGCDSRISAVVLDAAGQPVGASGNHRNATRRERRALQAQWGGCAVDGCARPFTRTRPHHVVPWWLSRITRLRDLAPICDSHHHDIHEGRRTLRLRDGRYINPTGWTDHPGR